jgi:hypothetical protein
MLDEKLFKKITQIEIPNYIYQVQVSKSRRVKYFHSSKTGIGKVKKLLEDLPKKHKAIIVGTDLEGFYIDKNGERVIANPLAAGTAKFVPINGQMFYSSGNQFTRVKIVNALHDFFSSEIKRVSLQPFKKSDYPIVITLEWFAPYSHKTMDITNMYSVYQKTFEDTLVNEGILIDDEVKYVTGGFPIYTPVEKFEDRKFIFTFYQDLRFKQLKLI